MLTFTRTDSNHPAFVNLVKQLDAYLATTDGDEHAFYDQYNKIDSIRYVILAEEDGQILGCGAIKEFEPGVVEVKRMYTLPASRGRGIASQILKELEYWAKELGYQKCILETGKRQKEAVRLYPKNGYIPIPQYGQYIGMENSVCFEKVL